MCRPLYLCMRFFFADNFKYDSSKMTTRAIMMSIPTLYLLIMELITFRGIEVDERSTIRCIMYPVFFLLALCYYRASYAQAFAIPKYEPQYIPVGQKCFPCNNWQPERAEHCAKCKKWILKSSMHNPCIANCLGYHNEKFFYLYLLYSLTIKYMFLEIGIRYSFYSEGPAETWIVLRAVYWVTNVFTYPTAILETMMTISTTISMWSNVTTMGMPPFKLYREDERNASKSPILTS